MKPGDLIEVEIAGIGNLSNPVIWKNGRRGKGFLTPETRSARRNARNRRAPPGFSASPRISGVRKPAARRRWRQGNAVIRSNS